MDDLGYLSPFANINGMGVDYEAMNKGVTPVFFIEPVQDAKATEEAGAPRFIEQERVRIIVAGDMLNQAVSPVTPEIQERFSDAYNRWKKGRQENHIDGTPLRAWPLASAAQIMEWAAVNILSVEHLAAVSDTNINRLADGRIWREKAIAWLASAKDGAAASKFAAENERLRDDLAELRRTVETLSAQVIARNAADDAEQRRGPGRPPKAA